MASQKILIIDDSKTIRMQIRGMLPKGNLEVLEARDGVEGLELINQLTPTLVLLDFFLPRMNGWEVVQRVHMNPKLRAIPIVIMSGRREEIEQSAPELLEYFEFLGKPFESAGLVQAIKSAMAKARQRLRPLSTASPSQPTAAASVRSIQAEIPAGAETVSPQVIQTLKAELQSLRRENAQLKTQVEGLQKQVSQILVLIRQRLK